ncbi:hypothetical protein [Alishewanella longhuensis]
MVTATLQLVPRQQVVREVALCSLAEMIKTVPQRVQAGYLYGDFQFEDGARVRWFFTPRSIFLLPAGSCHSDC